MKVFDGESGRTMDAREVLVMRRVVMLMACCILSGAIAGWLTALYQQRRLSERVAYFGRKVDRQEQDIFVLRRYLLSERKE